MTVTKFIVMGVSGCGKTSIGQGFARAIGATFLDGDDLHPAENVAKMARGEPLNDADRKPWLRLVAQRLGQHSDPIVIGCSALKKQYRDWIRQDADGEVAFLHLSGTRDLIAARMGARKGHFMPLILLDSQFAALEPPTPEETSATVSIDQTEVAIVSKLVKVTQEMRA